MSVELTKIDVRIPFEPGGRLGWDYNRVMNEAKSDWVLLLDHDVFLALNPHWYMICQKVISECEDDVGAFGCYASNIGNLQQRIAGSPSRNNDAIPKHIEFAKKVFDEFRYSTTQIDRITGMFMLIRKAAWKSVGGFANLRIFGADRKFSGQLIKGGWKMMRINGIYIYHFRDIRAKSWIEGEKVSRDYASKKYE